MQKRSSYFLYFLIVFALASIVVERMYNTYINSTIPKTEAYYKNQSFQYCVDAIQRNTIYAITKEQLDQCSLTVQGIYDERPQKR